jgi:hypothetical protein
MKLGILGRATRIDAARHVDSDPHHWPGRAPVNVRVGAEPAREAANV